MIWLNREIYHPNAKILALEAIERLRPTVFLGAMQLMGRRFKDSEAVFLCLESMYKQQEFLSSPLSTVEGALREAASADYWYEREKDYGGELEDDSRDEGVDDAY